MAWLWLLAGLILGLLLIDRLMERMYAYKITSPRRTPADDDIPFEEVRLPLESGESLAAWWIPGQTGRPTLVLVHGWSRNRERMLRHIRQLHAQGYHLLAFDARNHGDSDRIPHPTVWTFTEDTCAAVRYLENQQPQAAQQIGILGLSIGGGAAINAAGLCPQIRAVVTVGAIGHPIDTMRWEMEKKGLPDFIIRFLFAFMQWRYRIDLDAIAPVNHIGQAAAQFLIIHGERDETVSLEQARQLQQAAPPGQSTLWIVPGKGHSNCCTHPEFWPRVHGFLAQAFGSASPVSPEGQ